MTLDRRVNAQILVLPFGKTANLQLALPKEMCAGLNVPLRHHVLCCFFPTDPMNKKQFVLHQKHVCVTSPPQVSTLLSYKEWTPRFFNLQPKKWTSSSKTVIFSRNRPHQSQDLPCFKVGNFPPLPKASSFWGPSSSPAVEGVAVGGILWSNFKFQMDRRCHCWRYPPLKVLSRWNLLDPMGYQQGYCYCN